MARALQYKRSMKLRRAFRLLAGLPLLSLVALSAAACDGVSIEECDITRKVDRFVVRLPAEPSDALKVERCRVDVEACTALCLRDFEVSGGGFIAEAEACEVRFFDDHVVVAVSSKQSRCDDPDGALGVAAEKEQAR